MKRIAVVFWSGSGNTESMANAVAQGAQAAGADVTVYTAADFGGDMVADFDAIAFGCPSMGAEQLEDSEFEPMFAGCEPHLRGARIALFGSYGWGDGEWMRTWEDQCGEAGALLAADSVICQDSPDEDTLTACRALGVALVQ